MASRRAKHPSTQKKGSRHRTGPNGKRRGGLHTKLAAVRVRRLAGGRRQRRRAPRRSRQGRLHTTPTASTSRRGAPPPAGSATARPSSTP
ncbi:hypothetical protein GQ55_5G011800 [Panicum hallii var. hallii]|uniref:Uncharacterized protein n=1 Tax=Panicum hallii var. hallii TaxID=1504633 RepID=A0A2T7DBE7_9POAL|nr:hypothetical protein GQ55_5G011800 [Panicum hallii var. hallii]